jgi:hypothetical protein
MVLIDKVKTFHKAHPSLSTLVAVGAVGILAGGGYFGYAQWQQFNSPDSVYKREAEVYKTTYEEMMDVAKKQTKIPSNEVPVLATVTDPAALDKSDFYKNAQKGDKIVMFKKNKIVLLYRPSKKQVLARAQLNFIEPTPEIFETADSRAVAAASTSAQNTSPTPMPTVVSTGGNGLSSDKLFPQ